ncbi:MAG: helix-turn-helix transcriptional regulator [Planctomycetaceae bacterium]
MQLGPRLRELRLAAGLSQEQAAAAAGIPQAMWSGYELDKRWPGRDMMEALARGVGVEPAELLRPVGSKVPAKR